MKRIDVDRLRARVKALEEGIEDLLCQFAYETKYKGWPALGTAGLSALENGFDLIGWLDPQIAKWRCCQVIGCREHISGGSPIPGGYAMICSEHLNLNHSKLRFSKKCYAPRDESGILLTPSK